tara:strand:- start:3401 stop:3796 length:396 start_codon:yes stop_codon:yes gene_type:complete
MSLKRKLQKIKKKKAEKELKDKVMSFDRMPDCCVMCYKEFDRKSKEHHDTWIIVEKREKKRVSLFCPDCWENGLAVIKEDLYKKQTALDQYMENKNREGNIKKRFPQKQDYPEVQDYVKKDVPGQKGGEDE